MEEQTSDQKPKSRSREAFHKRREELAREKQKKGGPKEGTSGKFPWRPVAVILVAAAAAAGGGYGYKAMEYKERFLPHTVVNGMDVSGKNVQEVKDMISLGVEDYELTLKLRGGESEHIAGEAIGLHTTYDGSLEEIIRQQNPYAWPRYLLKGPAYDIETMTDYDQDALDKKIESLDCFDPNKATPPSDAYLSDYAEGQGYSIIPEKEGNVLREEAVLQEVNRAVSRLESQLDLDALGCYTEPSVRSDNAALMAARDARNRYVNITVTYTFGSETETLDGSVIHEWLISDGEKVSLDKDKVRAYVRNLAKRRNTAYTKRSFETSYGQTVEVSGFYGWKINETAETDELAAVLEAGESVTREPVYSQTAASHDGPDYGNTYAEVNLTAQHLILYKDGEKILESDFVSGNVSRGHTTPPGLFSLTYKQRDAVLKGEGYASPVKFWMPFNGGIGFHDASWRSSFGGAIYKTGGSHGCVNMPYDAARQLFEQVYKGMPVICYNLPGTENNKSGKASGKGPAASTPAPAVPQETAPPQPVPVETGAAAPPDQNRPEETGTEPVPPEDTGPQPPANQETQPEVSIQPVDQSAEDSRENQGGSGSEAPAGYGPAFQSSEADTEAGPGVP